MPTENLRLGMVLPFTLLDEAGRVLLAKGLRIEDAAQFESLRARQRVFVPFEESDLAVKVLMQGLLRAEVSQAAIKDLDKFVSFDTPSAAREPLRGTFPEQCAEVAARLRRLLGNIAQGVLEPPEAAARVEALWADLQQWASSPTAAEAATLVLTYRVSTSPAEYSVLHALQCAVLAQRVAPRLQLLESDRRSLVLATATMNVAMLQLQDVLAQQVGGLSPIQRAQIDAHAHEGARLLRMAGVEDRLWLEAVQRHHDALPGGALADLPPGQRLASIVQGLDRYTASMSPRASRPGRSAKDAARTAIARSGSGAQDPVGLALVQLLGLYPPGTFVRLQGGELALVLRPGQKAAAPVAAVVVNRAGEPLGTPRLADCSRPEFAVAESVPGSIVKARINLDQMVKLLANSRTPAAGIR